MPVSCLFCGKSFRDAYSLNRHLNPSNGMGASCLQQLQTIADKTCDVCNHTFCNVAHYRNHLTAHTHTTGLARRQHGENFIPYPQDVGDWAPGGVNRVRQREIIEEMWNRRVDVRQEEEQVLEVVRPQEEEDQEARLDEEERELVEESGMEQDPLVLELEAANEERRRCEPAVIEIVEEPPRRVLRSAVPPLPAEIIPTEEQKLEMMAGDAAHLRVIVSRVGPDAGDGVETTEAIARGSLIAHYPGKRLSAEGRRTREAEMKKELIKAGKPASTPIDTTRMFTIEGINLTIDGTNTRDRIGVKINHRIKDAEPNAYADNLKVNGRTEIFIRAQRDIQAGEEIYYDYGDRRKNTVDSCWVMPKALSN